MKTYAFIIMFNRLELPRKMADWLADFGVTPVFVDNASTYPPLLEYYEQTPHDVFRNQENGGCCAVWTSGVLDTYGVHERYIISDPDLDLSGIPSDWLQLLHTGLDRYSWAWKSGFSLEIQNLPSTPLRADVLEWERDKWAYQLDSQFYRAYIDTTFCMCRARVHDFPAVRTARPYTAKHMPWYYTPDTLPADERYYIETSGQWATYARKWRDLWHPSSR